MQLLSSVILIALMSLPNALDELVGNWNGALKVQGNTLRIVFHVKTLADAYEATLDSPDQNVKNIPVSVVKYEFPNVRFESAGIGMVFEGEIRGDQIVGTWKQSGMTFDLTLARDKSKDGK